ncbi:MAG: DUF4099 domain-containing protein [Parabacteroides sp.]|nr:DUF4099 domain-containing protein [Parabacteroides sp.]
MEQKKKEKDVLIVRDEKTGEISVVAGLNADGSPKRTAAKAENAKEFLQFDKHGDVLDNFFKNFFRQCKEPGRFGFYRVAADQADKLLDVMKELLKNPIINKDLLAAHFVDTSDYEKEVAKEQAAKQETKQEQEDGQAEQQQESAQEPKQEKRGYQPIDESKINWQELEEKWGVKRDELEKSGDLTKMLNYGKSDLIRVSPTFGGQSFELDARLSFRKNEDGSVGLVPHFIRKEQKLDEYKGHQFSTEDKKNLKETGNMGRVVDLVDKETGEITPSIISIDRKTNEITDLAASKIRVSEKIGQTEITPQEQAMLKAGLPVKDKQIVFNDGRKFVTTLQANVEKRGPEFVPGTTRSVNKEQAQGQENGGHQETLDGKGQRKGNGQTTESESNAGEKKDQRRNTWTDENGNIKPIGKWKGVPFTEQQKTDYVAGSTVKLENIPDEKGNKATLYIRFNREKGRPYHYDKNPDTAQKVAPSNESRTQVAVNNEGKTNEATKNLKEPLKQGQTAPKDATQKQQQENPQKRNKGMKV